MKKRGQSEVITTVLIILLVLAAVFIVYTAVKSMISTSTEKAKTQSDCFGTSITIVSANYSSQIVSITRDAGGVSGPGTGVTAKILVGGTLNKTTTTALDQLASDTGIIVTALSSTNKELKVAPILADGTVCGVSDTFTATA